MIISNLGLSLKPSDANWGSELMSISGVVMEQNIPCVAIVRCYEKKTGRLLDQTLSNPDGYYKFTGLTRKNECFIVSHNLSGSFNAVIQDNVVPK